MTETEFSAEIVGGSAANRSVIARYGDVSVILYVRWDGSLAICIETPCGDPENHLGPIGYVVMFNDADLYANPIRHSDNEEF